MKFDLNAPRAVFLLQTHARTESGLQLVDDRQRRRCRLRLRHFFRRAGAPLGDELFGITYRAAAFRANGRAAAFSICFSSSSPRSARGVAHGQLIVDDERPHLFRQLQQAQAVGDRGFLFFADAFGQRFLRELLLSK